MPAVVLPLIACGAADPMRPARARRDRRRARQPRRVAAAFGFVLLYAIVVMARRLAPFIYFQF